MVLIYDVQRLTFSLFFCNIVDLLVDKLCIRCRIPHLQKEISFKDTNHYRLFKYPLFTLLSALKKIQLN